jgi:hypothetical protein
VPAPFLAVGRGWVGALAPARAPAHGWAGFCTPGPPEPKTFFFFFFFFILFPLSYLYLDILCTKNYQNTS